MTLFSLLTRTTLSAKKKKKKEVIVNDVTLQTPISVFYRKTQRSAAKLLLIGALTAGPTAPAAPLLPSGPGAPYTHKRNKGFRSCTVLSVSCGCALSRATHSQSSGASGSLVSGLTRLTLMEGINGQLLKAHVQVNVLLFPTYSNSFGSGEANVSGLASRSGWAGRSSAAILSSGSLKEKTGPRC